MAVMKIRVLWPSGEVSQAPTATRLLESLCGGWNPDTIEELRVSLARRANIAPPTIDEPDLEFLFRLDSATLLCVQVVNDDSMLLHPSVGNPSLN